MEQGIQSEFIFLLESALAVLRGKKKEITTENTIAVLQTLHLALICFKNILFSCKYCQIPVFQGTHSKAEERRMPACIYSYLDQQYSMQQNITKGRKLKCQVVEALFWYSAQVTLFSLECLVSANFSL